MHLILLNMVQVSRCLALSSLPALGSANLHPSLLATDKTGPGAMTPPSGPCPLELPIYGPLRVVATVPGGLMPRRASWMQTYQSGFQIMPVCATATSWHILSLISPGVPATPAGGCWCPTRLLSALAVKQELCWEPEASPSQGGVLTAGTFQEAPDFP